MILGLLVAAVALQAIAARPAPVRFAIPAHHPRIAHFLGRGPFRYLVGDSLTAIKRAKRLRFKWIDQNAQCTRDGLVYVLHWPKVWKNGYRWYFTGRRDRRGREIRVPLSSIPAFKSRNVKIEDLLGLEVGRLREKRRGGRRPYQARTHMALCEAVGINLALEVKNSDGFLELRTWQRLAEDAGMTRARVAIMTLQNQGGNARALRRLTLAHTVGFPVALLPRGKRPANWSSDWQPLGIKVWGRWR